ncbi:MAG: YigZ family protein [Bacteroidales bacterium]
MNKELNDTFYTIEKSSQAVFKDKGSKFIAYAFPLETLNEINDKNSIIKAEHHKARHCCYAWRLGADMKNFRANDDGEPSGTAGKPILGQIQSFELTNILIIVVRYFGGTLLGVSGLINAYKTSAKEALTAANIITKEVHNLLTIEFEYPLLNDVMRIVKDQNIKITNTQYSSNCNITVSVKLSDTNKTLSLFNKIYGVEAKIDAE